MLDELLKNLVKFFVGKRTFDELILYYLLGVDENQSLIVFLKPVHPAPRVKHTC